MTCLSRRAILRSVEAPHRAGAASAATTIPPLVAAALACPVCLSGEVGWALEVDEWEAQVHCTCRVLRPSAGAVGLNTQQALRLYLNR